jgi:hypothetical protein
MASINDLTRDLGHYVRLQQIKTAVYLLTHDSFIEENNEYKNLQKELQRKRGSPPGMAPQELMMYWGKSEHFSSSFALLN